jgi:uncharacterized protein (TIGR00255 family)
MSPTEDHQTVLLSMTGIGEARIQTDRFAVQVEIRSVNNRHLKLTVRAGDALASFEPDFERLVRDRLKRGTVQLTVRVDRPRRAEDYRLNMTALTSYRDQIQTMLGPQAPPADLTALLVLPGVVEDTRRDAPDDPHEDWPDLARAVNEALDRLQESRAVEGRAMAAELLALGRAIAEHLDRIEARGPEVVASYQTRLTDRVRTLVERHGVSIEPSDLVREVALLADRADVSEEQVRLRAHLQQFEALIEGPDSAGRKLEFIVQEMGRETNTIGSKANDVTISREVVEIKAILEKVRELIQNIE